MPDDPKNDEIPVPEGAENPDAVRRLIQSERDAAKTAKDAAKEAERKRDEALAQVEPLTERIASLEADAQDAQQKLAEATNATAPLQAQVDRLTVALDKGLPKVLADRLKGDTVEALAADADALLALIPKNDDGPDFDAGPRAPAPPKTTPEEAHQKLLADLFGGAKG